MSEFEQDPSANTGRFRAFVERGDEEGSRSRSRSIPPAALIAVGVAVVIVIVIAVAL